MKETDELSLEQAIEKAVKDILKKKSLDPEKDKIKLDALNTAIKFLAVVKRTADDDDWGSSLRDEPPNGKEG